MNMHRMILRSQHQRFYRLSTMHVRSIFSPTTPLLAKKTVNVPTMGDSITEGTIVEWVVGVGQAVKADDVIALIETDKVTVDIKAEMDGVVTQQFGAVDQTVEVGSKLYEIDTEATATATSPTTTEPMATPKVQQMPAAAKTPAASAAAVSVPHGRTPSIHFLGKEGWAKQLSPAASKLPAKPNATTTLDGSFLTPMYGRPLFSEKDMETLILGGANIAPSVKTFSTGSTFVV